MAEDVHSLILRTYDVASARMSADDLMSEIAGCFSARAAGLVARNPEPSLICYGVSRTQDSCDTFHRSLQMHLSTETVSRLIEENLSVNFYNSDSGSYTLLFDTAGIDSRDDKSQQKFAGALIPHIIRSVELFSTTGRLIRQSSAALDQLNNHLVPATIALDRDGRIVAANARANELFRSSSVISQEHKRLRLRNPVLAQRMRNDLSSLLAGSTVEPRFMWIDENDEDDNLLLLMKPREDTRQGAVVYVHSMKYPPSIVLAHIVEKYGLTEKESRLVAGLMQGTTLRQLACGFHVSTHTLRVQMKSVFRKTAVSSQAALIVLMLDYHSVLFSSQEISRERK